MSCVKQSLPFTKIILLDDASEDDTADIASRFAAVEYRRVDFRDKHVTRSSVEQELPAYDFVLFIDADNWLDVDYHRLLIEPMEDPKVALTFCNIHRVDESGKPMGSMYGPAQGLTDLRDHNFIDVCSLLRVEPFLQVGGWVDRGDWQLEDWRLGLRLQQMGWRLKRVNGTRLNYRIRHERRQGRIDRWWNISFDVEWNVMRWAIVRPFCGRDCAAETVNLLELPPNSTVFVIADQSRAGTSALQRFEDRLREAKVSYAVCFHQFGETDVSWRRERNLEAFNRHLAKVFGFAASMIPASFDLVATWEDDIFPEQPDGLARLCRSMYQNKLEAIAAAVPVRTPSHDPQNPVNKRILCFNEPRKPIENVAGVREVQFFTFCLTLFRRAAWDRICWRPNTGLYAGHWANDFAAAIDCRREVPGKRRHAIGVDGSVTCGHHDGVRVLRLK